MSVPALLVTLQLLAGVTTKEPQALPAPPVVDGRPEAPSGETLFRSGIEAFDRHDYARAVELFESSYRASRVPAILYDIGQAYRALGDCRHALEAFETFVKTTPPDDPLLPRVLARREELHACDSPRLMQPDEILPGPGPPRPAPPPVPPAASPTATIPALPSVDLRSSPSAPLSASRLGRPCVAGISATLAAGAVGLALGVRAWLLARDVDGTQVWNSEAQSTDQRGRAFADASSTVLVVAGVAAALTATGCWLGWRDARNGARSEVAHSGR